MTRFLTLCAAIVAMLLLASTAARAEVRFTYTSQELLLPNGAGRAWVYIPEARAGDRIPVVLVGPAGSHLVDGMTLGESDRPEQIPYAQAGFGVISFDIPGMVTRQEEFVRGVRQFKEGEGGVPNARAALSLALSRFPRLDPSKVFVAGHSSAASLALTLCAKLEGLRGCVAYAPDVDLIRSRGELINELEPYVPGERAFMTTISPIELVEQIRSPVMIFNARDDNVVPVADIDSYIQRAQRAHVSIQRVVVNSGGHYESMIQEGIPAGIAWMRAQLGAGATR